MDQNAILTMREAIVATPHGVNAQVVDDNGHSVPVVRSGCIRTIRYHAPNETGWAPDVLVRGSVGINDPAARAKSLRASLRFRRTERSWGGALDAYETRAMLRLL